MRARYRVEQSGTCYVSNRYLAARNILSVNKQLNLVLSGTSLSTHQCISIVSSLEERIEYAASVWFLVHRLCDYAATLYRVSAEDCNNFEVATPDVPVHTHTDVRTLHLSDGHIQMSGPTKSFLKTAIPLFQGRYSTFLPRLQGCHSTGVCCNCTYQG